MKKKFVRTLVAAALVASSFANAEVIFYENDNFQGRSFVVNNPTSDFRSAGFNDRASSALVVGDRWEICEDSEFSGRCIVLRPGRYPSLASMNLNDRISSVRSVGRAARVDDNRYAPPSYPVYDNRRRGSERLFEANVSSVRAVMSAPNRQCWVERERVGEYQNDNNVPGAIFGAIIGGVLGHQIGGGRGKDIATALGAVTGAAVGGNASSDSSGARGYSQGVRRCETGNIPNAGRPEYWDVTYIFRGQEHRVQMAYAPGPTISVNRLGEPRS
jgi:uncharacterized protein YcfJ